MTEQTFRERLEERLAAWRSDEVTFRAAYEVAFRVGARAALLIAAEMLESEGNAVPKRTPVGQASAGSFYRCTNGLRRLAAEIGGTDG